MPEKPSFWTSVPGILTGLAALIAAISGILVTLNQIGFFDANKQAVQIGKNSDNSNKDQSVLGNAKTVDHTTEIKKEVYSRGNATIRGTWYWDFDVGIQEREDADVWWEQVTDRKRYLVPQNGAKFVVVGIRDFDAFGYKDFRKLKYSGAKIDGSDFPYNQIPTGTLIAGYTNERRFTKIVIREYGFNLKVSWVTYKK